MHWLLLCRSDLPWLPNPAGVMGLAAAYTAAFVDKRKVLLLEQFPMFNQSSTLPCACVCLLLTSCLPWRADSSSGFSRMWREMHTQPEL
jgi:hypothetical protein